MPKYSQLTPMLSQAGGDIFAFANGGKSYRETRQQLADWGIKTSTSFAPLGTGAVARTVQSKLRDIKHAYDIGCACDGSTDDWLKINTWVLAEITAGRTPVLEVPPGSTIMVSQALPLGLTGGVSTIGASYICRGGWATIKAHPTSTDNVIGESGPTYNPYRCVIANIIIDGNQVNVSWNTRNGGLTDDAYQNGLRLQGAYQGFFYIQVQNTVNNGISIYNGSVDNMFFQPRVINIGKSSPPAGAYSHNGIFIEYGCARNKIFLPHVESTKQAGIWSGGQGSASTDNEIIFPRIVSPGTDGIIIGSTLTGGSSVREKIISPTITGATSGGAAAIRITPTGTSTISDLLIESPTITDCTNGIVLAATGTISRPRINNPSVYLNGSGQGIALSSATADAVVVGGYSLNCGTNFLDNGVRTRRIGTVISTVQGLLANGTASNDDAAVGDIGEYQPATTGATGMTDGVVMNATSVPLTAGDWDVDGVVNYAPAATTTFGYLKQGISATPATFGAQGSYTTHTFEDSGGGNVIALATPTVRIKLAADATVYLVAQAGFSVSTITASGFIRARRVR